MIVQEVESDREVVTAVGTPYSAAARQSIELARWQDECLQDCRSAIKSDAPNFSLRGLISLKGLFSELGAASGDRPQIFRALLHAGQRHGSRSSLTQACFRAKCSDLSERAGFSPLKQDCSIA